MEIRNRTPLAAALNITLDKRAAEHLVLCVKGTWSLTEGQRARFAEEQDDILPADECVGEPGLSSVRYEADMGPAKLATDVALVGSAVARKRGTREMEVMFRVGPVQQRAKVVGERRWTGGVLGIWGTSGPEPFERVPLQWEYAVGGTDKSHPDEAKHSMDERNPLGRGFRDTRAPIDRDVELPAIEDPAERYQSYGDAPAPVGFGFVAPHVQPRAAFAGTYDARWLANRMPLLPLDFDRRFFAAASPGLACAQPLQGGERASVVGTTARGRLDFTVPALGTPLFHAHLSGRRRTTLKMALDTVVIDTDAMSLTLLWRAHLALRNGLHDLLAGEFHLPDARARSVLRGSGAAAPRRAA